MTALNSTQVVIFISEHGRLRFYPRLPIKPLFKHFQEQDKQVKIKVQCFIGRMQDMWVGSVQDMW